jgi:DNA polymerase-3 subunit alpha
VQNGRIVFGMTAIKGCGRAAAEEIVRVRKAGGPFKDMYDLGERIDLKVVPKIALEKLIKAGALDCFQAHRAQLMAVLPRALQAAGEREMDRRVGQRNLFEAFATEPVNGNGESHVAAETLPDVTPWSETEKLKYEKEVLDFYFSSHLLAQYEKDMNRYATHLAKDIPTCAADQEVTVAGMINGLRFRDSKRGRFAAFKFEDLTGSADAVVWSDSLPRCKDGIEEEAVRIFTATVSRRKEEPLLEVTRVMTLEQAAVELCKEVWIRLQDGRHRPSHIDALVEILRETNGPCPVKVEVRDRAGRRCMLKLGRDFWVNPRTVSQDKIEELLGSGCVKMV